VIFDLGRGGTFTNRPGPDFGARALRSSKRTERRGSIGAGTGARAGGLQGGVGMASVTVELPGQRDGRRVVVAALAVVNASGSLIDPSTGAPWIAVAGLRRPDREDRARWRAAVDGGATPLLNTTIGVVATGADLSRPEAGRLAMSAHDGLARAIRPAHSLMDGDTVFALATGRHELPSDAAGILRSPDSRSVQLNALFAAASEAFATACIDAVVTASMVGDTPTYRDLCPSAWPG